MATVLQLFLYASVPPISAHGGMSLRKSVLHTILEFMHYTAVK